MNKQLYQAYKNLTETERSELRQRYKDSPVGLKLIEFLEMGSKSDFKVAEAVAHIYRNDSAEAYSVLENRYFKLRKKMYDELLQIHADKKGAALPEEEAMLNKCKDMISAGERKGAYKLLSELERTCWERNIFELLPSIIDNMIFCNQATNDIEKNRALYPSLEKAIELQYDLNKALMYIRQVYEVTMTKGPQHSKNLLLALKELGTKNSEYPRFIMFYHYVSVSYKLSSMEYTQNMQVISRHLAEFNKLYAKHTLIPMVIYKANHAKLFHYHFNQITAFIHTNKLEFEEAYQAVKEMWNMANGSDSLFRTYKSDSLYFNLFTLQCMTRRYREAFEACELFAAFLRNENRIERLPFANMMKAMLYATAYPQTFKIDAAYLLEQAGEYIRSLKRADSVQLPMAQAMMFKAEIHLLLGDSKAADRELKDERVQSYLAQYNAADLFNELMEIVNRPDSNGTKRLQELGKQAQQCRYKATRLDELVALNWILGYIGRVLESA